MAVAVSKKAKALYNAVFDGAETAAANVISYIQETRDLKKHYSGGKVPKEYAKAYKAFWGKYVRVSPKWGWYYASKNGNADVRYVPHTLYYTKIDQHFNARKLGYGFNDKNYYSRIFPDICQPKTLVRKIGATLFDENYRLISAERAMCLLEQESEIVVKPSQESGSGRGIMFCKPTDERDKLLALLKNEKEKDYIFQAVVKQHPLLEAVHKNSLNTIRVVTLLLDGEVHVLSAVLRMGVNNSRIDNVTAGGISAAINADGTLQKYAFTYFSGEKTEQHPQGLVFEGHPVPEFDAVIETVKKAACYIGNFRLVSWDMSVDADGNVLLIEANMRKGGINLHQFDNGPLFGELTEKVLADVFKRQGG